MVLEERYRGQHLPPTVRNSGSFVRVFAWIELERSFFVLLLLHSLVKLSEYTDLDHSVIEVKILVAILYLKKKCSFAHGAQEIYRDDARAQEGKWGSLIVPAIDSSQAACR